MSKSKNHEVYRVMKLLTDLAGLPTRHYMMEGLLDPPARQFFNHMRARGLIVGQKPGMDLKITDDGRRFMTSYEKDRRADEYFRKRPHPPIPVRKMVAKPERLKELTDIADAAAKQREEVREELRKFYAGTEWTDEQKAEMAKLPKRPLRINKIGE